MTQSAAPMPEFRESATEHDAAPLPESEPSMQPESERHGRALVIISVAIAVLSLLAAPLHAVLLVVLFASGVAPASIALATGAVNLVSALLALVAGGFAVASLLRRERHSMLAGAVIGVGVAVVVALLAGGLQALLFGGLR